MYNDHFYKILRFLIILVVIFPVFTVKSQVYLTEGFELGAKPEGWTEEYVTGTEPWRYRNGGHSPNDNNWDVPPDAEDITRNPPSAYDGTYNAIFFKQGDDNERTKLVTPSLNLMGGASLELSFYLCQIPWYFEGSTGWDVLRVYYKVSESAPWILLHEYLDPVYEWELQTLALPNPSATYYIAFEGHTRWGYGTCIDDVKVESKGVQPMWIKDIDFQQPFSAYVPSGSQDVPVIRVDFTVYGNTDTIKLNSIQFTSLNTSDSDILPGGVILYSTSGQTFDTRHPLGSPANFTGGTVNFSGLNHSLPPGHSYVWLAYDLKNDITYGHILDVKVAANSISAGDTLYPASEESPYGIRTVYTTQYFENFEGTHNWNLTGEFEVSTPSGLGGLPGLPDPSSAYSGTRVLGTDLTGLGLFPYNYEPDLNDAESYKATSPSLNLFYYKSLNLFFQRYLNIEVWDSAFIQVSIDNGATWNNIWDNYNKWISDFQWNEQRIEIPDQYSRTRQLMIRFKMGPTNGEDNYSGWNIDDIYLTGEFITRDVGVSQWIYPLSGSGHTSDDSVTVCIKNYGGAEITDPVPVAYSFDGGLTWVTDYMNVNIPVGDSVIFTFPTRTDLSVPGLRPSVMAKTMFPGDQYTGNDQVSTQLYIVPTYTVPYSEPFETNDGFWRSLGNQIWEYGTPAGSVINTAASGTKSWVTGLTETYGDIISRKNSIILDDDFETDMGWSYTGEFERNVPSYIYLPYFAYSGYYCMGTDLSGKGTTPYSYENGISPATAYTATSPAFDLTSYSNLTVGFQSWITIRAGDSIRFEVSPDNGASWYTIWKNTEGEILEEDFSYREYAIPDSLSNSSAFRLRFSLYYSTASDVAQGWTIDNLLLTGDLVDTSEGILTSPSYDLRGLANPVFETRLWTDTEQDTDGATLLYSLDDGRSWTPVSDISGYDTYWNWYSGKHVSALGLDGWSGQSNGWFTARHLLPAALINQKNIQFRFKFMADKFNNQFDGVAADDIKLFDAPYDIGVYDILAPFTACELDANQKFTLRLKNYGIRGMHAGDSIRIGYHVDRSGDIRNAEETIYLTQDFPAGSTRDFSMTTEFDYSISGEYQTSVFTIEADPFFYQPVSNDTLYRLIRVNKPVVELGPDISTVRPDTLILKAYSGVAGYNYLWQDNSTDSVFHVASQGTYYVRVTNDLGCVTSDTVNVTELIADVGISELTGPHSACELGSQLPVEILLRNFGTDTIDINDTIYLYREINSDLLADTLIITQRIFPDSTLNYTYKGNFDFSSPGVYNMKMYASYRDDHRNNNDTLQYMLEVYGYPSVDLGPDTIVSAPEYILTATPGYYSYLWQDGSALNTFTVETPGRDIYKVTVSDEHQCTTADSVQVTLNVTDIELNKILSPETSCGLSETITVSARAINKGNQAVPAGQSIVFSYQVDEGSPDAESYLLAEDMMPGDTIDYIFGKKAQVVTGQWYDFKVYLNYGPDMKPFNDTILMPVGVFATPVVNLGEDFQVVTGLEYVLDAGPGFVSYLWQDGSTGSTFTVKTPGISHISVTVTDSNGCTGFDETDIMLSVPDIGVVDIVHPQVSCGLGADEHIRLAIRNLGSYDIEPSANISVSYSVNGGAPVTENLVLETSFEHGSDIFYTFSGSEDFSIPGTYRISANTVYGTDLIPSNDTLEVTIDTYASPAVDIGNGQDTIVTYDPIVLSATPGYASYRWQDGTTTPDYAIQSHGAAMYSVTVTSDHGCSTTDSVFVAYDLPDMGIVRIVNPVTSCELDKETRVSFEIMNNGFYRIRNESFIASYAVNGGIPVQQTFYLDDALQPASTVTVTFDQGYDFSAAASYAITVTIVYAPDTNNSNDQSGSSINVWGSPEVEIGNGNDTVTATLPVTLNAGTGFASYLWQDNTTASTISAIQPGLYWVRVTDAHNCPATDSVYILSSVHIEDLQDFAEVKIYPNPVHDALHIIVKPALPGQVKLELYTLLNTLIYREDFKISELVTKELNVQRLSPGVYFLRITSDQTHRTYKVVVN
jgi:hypothetical protein